jgi:hemerythrin-like metal-binding protein
MAFIEWRDDFSIGLPSVDHEHQELIGLINTAYENLHREDAQRRVIDFLGEIYARISAHFALEERIMRERHYDEYADHKADHERLLDEMRDIMDSYEEHAYFDEDSFAEQLRQWFVVHFKTKDPRLHRFLAG